MPEDKFISTIFHIEKVDLSGFGKPLVKLINTVASFFEPWKLRRTAAAEADAARLKAKSDVEVALIKAEGSIELQKLAERASLRLNSRELRRQENIEAILLKAKDFLPGSVSDEPVDPDWVADFFGHCEDVSNDTMQSLWARLLAGEVARPNTFSLKTLNTVKILRKDDADLFSVLCNYVVEFSHGLGILRDNQGYYLDKKGLGSVNIQHLADLGLVHSNDWDYGVCETFKYGRIEYRIETMNDNWERRFEMIQPFGFRNLTIAGSELYPLCKTDPDEEYIKYLLETSPEKGIIFKEVKYVG